MSVNFGGFTLHLHKVLLLQSGEEKKLDSCAHQVAFEWSPIELSWVSLTQIIQVSLAVKVAPRVALNLSLVILLLYCLRK